MPMKIQEAYRTPNRLGPKQKSPCHIIIKKQNIQSKEIILRAAKEKGQVTYKGRLMRITPDLSLKTMKDRRSWSSIMQTLRGMDASPDYYTQQNFQSPEKDKARYSITKPELTNT